jgi:hypothetical protein
MSKKQNIPQSEETGQIIHVELEKLAINPDVSDLLTSYREIRAEEQRLLEIRQQTLSKQNDLKNKLIKAIEKRKASITNLTSEIAYLNNRNLLLEQALDSNIHNKTPTSKTNSSVIDDTKIPNNPPECIGLLKCQKPEECKNYESCLEEYLAAEMRNDILKL